MPENFKQYPMSPAPLESIPSVESLTAQILPSPQELKGPPGGTEEDTSLSEQLSSEISTSNDDKQPRRKRSSFKHKLVVEKVSPDGTVECKLFCRQKTISFKFNRLDTKPSDIIEGMIKKDLLKEGPHTQLTEQLQQIIDSLKIEPDKIPECGKAKPTSYNNQKVNKRLLVKIFLQVVKKKNLRKL